MASISSSTSSDSSSREYYAVPLFRSISHRAFKSNTFDQRYLERLGNNVCEICGQANFAFKPLEFKYSKPVIIIPVSPGDDLKAKVNAEREVVSPSTLVTHFVCMNIFYKYDFPIDGQTRISKLFNTDKDCNKLKECRINRKLDSLKKMILFLFNNDEEYKDKVNNIYQINRSGNAISHALIGICCQIKDKNPTCFGIELFKDAIDRFSI